MKYLAIVSAKDTEKMVAFEVKIFSEDEEKQVGSASVVFNNMDYKWTKRYFDYYVPSKYQISEDEITQKCYEVIATFKSKGRW